MRSRSLLAGAVVAAATIATLGAGLSPAAAGTGTISTVLDESSSVSPSRQANGTVVPCGTLGLSPGNYSYDVQVFSVSESGGYSFQDRFVDGDAKLYIFEGDAEATPRGGAGCIAEYDDAAAAVELTAGTRYQAVLTGFSPGQLGQISFAWSGPGDLTLGEPSLDPERALAACEPGAAVPNGYTLREGTSRAETLTGTAGKDLIRGLGGNDTIRGLGGDDVLCGGAGIDTIDGGEGADFLFGEADQDVLSGGVGDDHLDGGVGNDTLNGNDGADTLLGGEGQDTLYGQAGDDELFGNAGNDVLDGGPGTDVGTDTDPRSVFRNLETVNGPAPVTPAAR